ncbi:hypothetical protein CEXT_812761 [Caerostris extrusa]|uniref:Uncharacterized protein n=1 Tax=Caerostris extrusa TaxID=172846 RepID=A0AAV4NHX9_CAEEX|nr:hypothetical protein CEXT_812761 [Caerostris extrusa]
MNLYARVLGELMGPANHVKHCSLVLVRWTAVQIGMGLGPGTVGQGQSGWLVFSKATWSPVVASDRGQPRQCQLRDRASKTKNNVESSQLGINGLRCNMVLSECEGPARDMKTEICFLCFSCLIFKQHVNFPDNTCRAACFSCASPMIGECSAESKRERQGPSQGRTGHGPRPMPGVAVTYPVQRAIEAGRLDPGKVPSPDSLRGKCLLSNRSAFFTLHERSEKKAVSSQMLRPSTVNNCLSCQATCRLVPISHSITAAQCRYRKSHLIHKVKTYKKLPWVLEQPCSFTISEYTCFLSSLEQVALPLEYSGALEHPVVCTLHLAFQSTTNVFKFLE